MFILQRKLMLLGIALYSFGVLSATQACTTAIVTKGASADGSVFVTHSNDGLCDPSIVYVPAKNHPAGAMRKVYPSAIAWDPLPEYKCLTTPRLQAPERAKGYDNPALQKENTIPLGEIPEVAHTYAYLDSDYGIMNEHGLMLGECTNNSYIENTEITPEGGIFYAAELGRVALERCKTAREAILLMGKLIDTYGLYATAETLLVADKNEGWVLEMQPLPRQKKGYWVAQRVPDGEVFVAANQLRIRELDVNNPDQLMNPNLLNELKQSGLAVYDEKSGKIDWLRSMKGVEDYHPYFATRRVWRFLDLVAPSLNLPSKLTSWYDKSYPFSVKPDKKLTRYDLMKIHKDYYNGTEFDTSKKPASGIYEDPAWCGLSNKFERSIYKLNSTYTWILEANPSLPTEVAWLSLAVPGDSTFVPLAVAPVPESYEKVNRDQYDATKAWWNYTAVSELIHSRYNLMSPMVSAAAQEQEKQSGALLEQLRGQKEKKFVTALRKNAMQVQKDWQQLFGNLLVKYCQGNGAKAIADKKVSNAEFLQY